MTAPPGWLAALPAVAGQVPDLSLCVVDGGHRFVCCHGAWLQLRGLTPDDVVGRPVVDLVSPAFADLVTRLVDAGLAGRSERVEIATDHPADSATGTRRAVWDMGVTPLRSPTGEALALFTARNVLRSRAADAARTTSDHRFRAAFDATPEPMLLLTTVPGHPAGALRVLHANRALGHLVGRPAADLVGVLLTPAVAGGGPGGGLVGAELPGLVGRALRGGGDLAVDSWLRHTDGTRVPVSVACSPPVPATDEDGTRRTELVVLLRDTAVERATHRALTEALAGEHRAAQYLRQLERQRGDFVAAVSHELRTPMTSILGNLEVLLDGDAGALTPMQTLMLATVEHESQRLRRLIEDLLRTASAQAGEGPAVQPGDVDLAAVAQDAAAAASGALTGRGLSLTVDAAGPAWVRGDAERLRGVVAELLGNAAKVGPAGTRVSLRCTRSGADVVVTVADTGPGIADDDLPFVFEPFYRTAHAASQAVPGTGIGLTLVAATVSAHGGTVSAASGPDGAVLTVRLPAAGSPSPLARSSA